MSKSVPRAGKGRNGWPASARNCYVVWRVIVGEFMKQNRIAMGQSVPGHTEKFIELKRETEIEYPRN